MTSHYHAVVWIDHHEARIFHFKRARISKPIIKCRHSSFSATTITIEYARAWNLPAQSPLRC